MTRVIHTGDTHIGYQQYHSPVRRRDFLAAFDQLVDDAVAEEVDAVIHAGDLFHDRRPDLRDLLGTLSALRRLDDAGIPFLAVVGNHESTRGGQWLDLYERLGLATRLGREPIVIGETAFYGLDWVPRSKRADLDYDFAPHDATFAALVAHGLFTPFAHADWETETVLAESSVAFDAVLLGDNHKPDAAEVDGAWVTYCGSTERASASEREQRGYNLVSFDGEVDVRRRALETRPFVVVSVELAEGEGVERVREQVRQHDLADAVVVVEIVGDGDPLTPASVEEFATDRGALIARVKDRREINLEADGSTVSFADPDDAVRDRIGDLGLSAAALDVDETIRASKVADSKVRAEVRARIESLVEDDLDSFVPAEANEIESCGEDTDGSTGAVRDAENEVRKAENGGDGEGDGDESDATGEVAPAEAVADSDPPVSDSPRDADPEVEVDDGSDSGAASGDSDAPDDAPASRDGQVSMEDYL